MNLSSLKKSNNINTDKGDLYLRTYDEFFQPIRESEINLLEIGLYRGDSLQLWSSYFLKANIFGLDLNPPSGGFDDRVKVDRADQASEASLKNAITNFGVQTFDVIIDDASHFGSLSAATFSYLFDQYLNPGGLYIVEDWGVSYWSEWPDGQALEPHEEIIDKIKNDPKQPPYCKERKDHLISSHQAGMVGFIKLLVDFIHMPEAETGRVAGFEIESLTIRKGIAVVRKLSSKEDKRA